MLFQYATFNKIREDAACAFKITKAIVMTVAAVIFK